MTEDHTGTVFLSYRRQDTQWAARGVYDRLSARYGQKNVFRDLDTMPSGYRFREVIKKKIAESDVFVVLIGDKWTSQIDGDGRRRLDLPDDPVRMEVEIALGLDLPVIPVLVEGAAMPGRDEMPPSIAGLVEYNAAHLTDSRWDYDISRLVQEIDGAVDARRSVESREERAGERPDGDRSTDPAVERAGAPPRGRPVGEGRSAAPAFAAITIITTAVLTLLAVYVLVAVVGLPAWSGFLLGVSWAASSALLDRLIERQWRRLAVFGRPRATVALGARVALALLMAATVSTGLGLAIFRTAIDGDQASVMAAARAALEQDLRNIDTQISDIEATLAASSSTATDPDVQDLQGRYQDAVARADEANADVVCELDGTCGSGKVGGGPAVREKTRIRDEARFQQAAIGDQLRTAQLAAEQRVDGFRQSKLPELDSRLEALQNERAAQEATISASANRTPSVWARSDSLWRLAVSSAAILVTQLALFGLIAVVALLPAGFLRFSLGRKVPVRGV